MSDVAQLTINNDDCLTLFLSLGGLEAARGEGVVGRSSSVTTEDQAKPWSVFHRCSRAAKEEYARYGTTELAGRRDVDDTVRARRDVVVRSAIVYSVFRVSVSQGL